MVRKAPDCQISRQSGRHSKSNLWPRWCCIARVSFSHRTSLEAFTHKSQLGQEIGALSLEAQGTFCSKGKLKTMKTIVNVGIRVNAMCANVFAFGRTHVTNELMAASADVPCRVLLVTCATMTALSSNHIGISMRQDLLAADVLWRRQLPTITADRRTALSAIVLRPLVAVRAGRLVSASLVPGQSRARVEAMLSSGYASLFSDLRRSFQLASSFPPPFCLYLWTRQQKCNCMAKAGARVHWFQPLHFR